MRRVGPKSILHCPSILLSLALIILAPAWTLRASSDATQSPNSRSPILIELFTSEGCSSCPPADTFLEKLDSAQPVPTAELIVLSEHVDYWNHDGWKDPFSSSSYTDRQDGYKQRFGLKTVYTPEMVVDGASEFLGSDVRSAERALTDAMKSPKIPVTLSRLSIDASNTLQVHIDGDALPESSHEKEANVYLAVVLHHAESDVLKGENAGHHLGYANVVQNLKDVGVLRQGQAFSQDVSLKLQPGTDQHNLRFVAFVQEKHQGKVLGATIQSISNP
ncbi:MAG: DUF1223 domain-containing protein [Terriglobales bacterium]|jgi:hypothetical protein|nr:DUF1223 domain-containing protein [Terriglobales bacterium]